MENSQTIVNETVILILQVASDNLATNWLVDWLVG